MSPGLRFQPAVIELFALQPQLQRRPFLRAEGHVTRCGFVLRLLLAGVEQETDVTKTSRPPPEEELVQLLPAAFVFCWLSLFHLRLFQGNRGISPF